MRVYTVHQDPTRRPEEAECVKDGFCWPALFIPLLWLIYRRLWLGLVVWLGVTFALALLVDAGGLDDTIASAILLGFQLLVAFEANSWRRWTLERHGSPQVATVVAADIAQAEMRYFELRAARPRPTASSTTPPPPPFPNRPAPPIPRHLTEGPALGLYPQPERRG